ncbi:hypothetical protein ABZ725_00110 [Streptomyces sp. NPDC006872]|uniref:hypothetical protein n=1 Tax=Streptomyces sp. NPDC006872 TaxID=3155720 RepID=UPI0033F9A495
MPTRRTRRRVRPLAAALTAVAVLTLTACDDGQGLRDEGPSSPATLNGSAPLPGSYGVSNDPAGPHAEPPSGNS